MRKYSNQIEDTAFHALGNGEMVVAVNGLDIYRFQYLAGRFLFSAKVYGDALVEAESRKLDGKMEWVYTIQIDGKAAGTMREYVTVDNCFVREFDISRPLTFNFTADTALKRFRDGYVSPAGTPYINYYKTVEDVYVRVFGENVAMEDFQGGFLATVSGRAKLVVKIGFTYPSKKIGAEYNTPPLPYEGKYKDEVEYLYYLTYAYRVETGGIISAIEWNLSYFRDIYGFMRGLLAAGLYKEAKEQLDFKFDFFERAGYIATAYSVGKDYTTHDHECDASESPAYFILMAFDYANATGDNEIIEKHLPALRWAFYSQLNCLYKGMMPFSGDETYTAGNMLPKVHLDDGSAESTMLLIRCADYMLPYLYDPEAEKKIASAKALYRENFIRDGRLIANNPARREAPLPPKKHGCCIYCYSFTDLRPNRYGLYTCKDCKYRDEDLRSDKIYCLSCVELLPAFIGSELFTKEELKPVYEGVARALIKDGYIPSGAAEQGKCTGYEFGLLLYGLKKTGSELVKEVEEIVLKMRDKEGYWAEYYHYGVFGGMRCRIWETGLNICALLEP